MKNQSTFVFLFNAINSQLATIIKANQNTVEDKVKSLSTCFKSSS